MLKKLSNTVINADVSPTVGIADIVKQMRERGEEVFDFSAGRAFENTPKYITDGAVDAMYRGETHQTMARGTTQFRQACANKLSRENDIIADPGSEIIATMGTKQGLTISLLALLNAGDEVLVEDPCFVSYHQLISFFAGVSVSVPMREENQFRWDKKELEDKITKKTKAIIFNSPHNPTGTVHNIKDLELIAQIAIENNLYVITDEIYERTVWKGHKHVCLATLPGMKERTITLMGLTKSFSMGGWRIGFAYASKEIIDQFEKLQQHLITSANSFVQAGATIAFGEEPKDVVLNYWSDWEEKCRFACETLNKIEGLSCLIPEGGFYAWLNISKTGLSSEIFAQRLLKEERVALVPGHSFGSMGKNFVRITCVKSSEETEEGIKRIKRFVEKIFKADLS